MKTLSRTDNSAVYADGDTQVRVFMTVLAGTTHNNADRRSRRSIIAQCSPKEKLLLARDPQNRYDPNAIRVCRQNGEQIGFIGARVAASLAQDIDAGKPVEAYIAKIEPDEFAERPSYRVTIAIGIQLAPKNGN